MIDLKKIINKPVNLSGPKGLNKNPLMDKFRDNKIKRVNFKYKEEKEEEVVVGPQKPERSDRIRKHRNNIVKNGTAEETIDKKKAVAEPKKAEKSIKTRTTRNSVVKDKVVEDVVKNVHDKKLLKFGKDNVKKELKNKESSNEIKKTKLKKQKEYDDVITNKPVLKEDVVINKPVVKEVVLIKELPPEVIEAKENLTYLKKTLAKLLLPVKWSR